MTKKILMISMGNTCRSPIAEAIMRLVISQRGLQNEWEVQSASTFGKIMQITPDKRVFNVLNKHGVDYLWKPRIIFPEDFNNYDYIFAMDERNLEAIHKLKTDNSKAVILLLGDFGLLPEDRIIMDPFHIVGEEYFEKVYQQCFAASMAFLAYATLEEEEETNSICT